MNKRNESLSNTLSKGVEDVKESHHHLLCWKSVVAGVLISILSFMILTALGAGVSGMIASRAIINEEGGGTLASLTGVWLGLSAVISLFMGSYYTLRISRFVTNKVGAAHGFVVASIFFLLLVAGAGSGIGSLSHGIGRLAEGVGSGAAGLTSNSAVQDVLYKAVGTGALRSDPKDVMQGLATRLMQGDTASAKSYLAYQTGLAPAEVDARINQAKADFEIAASKAATAVADAGWSLFVTLVVGLLASMIGGRIGAHANVDRPLATEPRSSLYTGAVAVPV